ncbi:MAG: hypothetical protein H6607_12255 [Flavobacteriales bacterium]|nr:hypothetical protein [Flavobacteriales bacterium]
MFNRINPVGLFTVFFVLLFGCERLQSGQNLTDFLDSNFYEDYDQAIKLGDSLQKPVLLVFTSYGVSLSPTEQWGVFIARKNQRLLSEKFVCVVLNTDDKRPSKDSLSTIGKKNFELQYTITGFLGQPTYCILSSSEKVMGVRGYTSNADTLYQFLKEGFTKYGKINFGMK